MAILANLSAMFARVDHLTFMAVTFSLKVLPRPSTSSCQDLDSRNSSIAQLYPGITLWPDVAKFRHLGYFFPVRQKVNFIYCLAKFWVTFADFFML